LTTLSDRFLSVSQNSTSYRWSKILY
jgi:hypothetical protein